MPPKYLFDISTINLDGQLFDQEAIRAANPQRGDMEHLNAIVWAKPEDGLIIGFKDVRADEFWVEGHIPGRPLLPGVLMIEAGAPLASFYTPTYVGWEGFIRFGGGDEVQIPIQNPPRGRVYILGKKILERQPKDY